MNFTGQGSSAIAYGVGTRFLVGSVLISVGILLAAGGGSWDITNHLLNKPETFFAPPHAILYSGAGTSVVGALLMFSTSRSLRNIPWQVKLAVAGVILLVTAGPVDFAWHSAFGLDGLLSPPHFVLVSGMVMSSLGALAGMAYYRASVSRGGPIRLHTVLIVVGILPLWLSLSGVVEMFTLPFSNTDYFNFNPDPTFAVGFATVGFPVVIAGCLFGASALAGRRFGALSITGSAFVVTSILTSIVPDDALHSTIPFYALNIIPMVAADAVLSYRFWKPFGVPIYAAGSILGITFFMLYFPLIAYTYNEFVDPERILWSSLTIPIYFNLMETVYPLVVAPAAAMGAAGALAADRLAARNKIL